MGPASGMQAAGYLMGRGAPLPPEHPAGVYAVQLSPPGRPPPEMMRAHKWSELFPPWFHMQAQRRASPSGLPDPGDSFPAQKAASGPYTPYLGQAACMRNGQVGGKHKPVRVGTAAQWYAPSKCPASGWALGLCWEQPASWRPP